LLEDTVAAGGNAKLSKRPSITWSDNPVAVTYSRPYAVAMLPGHIEASILDNPCHVTAPCYSHATCHSLFYLMLIH